LLPLKDLNRPLRTPHVNRLLLITNIAVFAAYWLSANRLFLSPRVANIINESFTLIPQDIIHGQRLYTLITSMFMHSDWFHLLGNMLFLYIFGDNIEDVFGHFSYLLFYLICGFAAVFAHIMSIPLGLTYPPDFTIGIVGASGAISGVLGAYFVLHPKARILSVVAYFILPVPAVVFLGLWFVMQWFYGFFDISGGVAYWAHIGGFVMGIILALAFGLKKKKARTSQFQLRYI